MTFLKPLLETYTTVGIDVYPGIGEEDRVYLKNQALNKTEYEQNMCSQGNIILMTLLNSQSVPQSLPL